jgi:uncharacterized damage-inducible protein DinB
MKSIQKMFEHMHWANKRILEGITSPRCDHQQVIRFFAHILQSEQIWLTRLQGKDSSHLSLWPDIDLSVCDGLVQQNNENYTAYLNHLTGDGIDDVISYRNQTGKEYKTSIRDILTHVALHGQYHRGQLNSLLRIDGYEPVNVDFITFVR